MSPSALFSVSLVIIFIVEVFGNKQNPFTNDYITAARNNPKVKTIDDEFLVFFDEDCLEENESSKKDVINEFLDEFECYSLNKEKVNNFRKIGNYFIVVNKIEDCNDNDDKEIEFSEYCLVDVDQNQYIEFSNTCTSRTVETALWNLNQASPSIPNGVEYIEYSPLFEAEFDIIVQDSGVECNHEQFAGIDCQRIYQTHSDTTLYYHGTHVAGTIVGRDYGVFRAQGTQFRVIDVKMGNQFGSLDEVDIMNSFDAVIAHLQSISPKKGIINMSFGGFGYPEWNAKVRLIRQNGGIAIAAAGNSNSDASFYAPAGSNGSIAVGAHDQYNDRASFSNYGDSVDIYAPGVDILSSFPNNSTGVIDGTSMASPFVVGIAANILANNPSLDFDGIKQRLRDFAVYDIDDGRGNTNLPRAQISCETYCDGGDCGINGVCSNDEDCGWSFVCDNSTNLCERDCDTFDIDGFLDCSIVFENAKGNLTSAKNEINGIDERINAFRNESNDLQKEINETYRKIKKLSKSYRKQLNKQNANSNPMENIDDDNGKYKLLSNTFQSKDVLIIGLLSINVLLINYVCLCRPRGTKQKLTIKH